MAKKSDGACHIAFFRGEWACVLTACFLSHVQTISADPSGISLGYVAAPWGHIAHIADTHCAQFGKEAWPAANTTVGDAYHHLQRFECIERAAAPTPSEHPPPQQPPPTGRSRGRGPS